MAYTDPSTLTFALNENPLGSAKLNNATNNQFLALFPDEDVGVAWTPNLEGTTSGSVAAESGGRFRIGPLQFVWARFVSPSGLSGTFFVELPVAASGLTAHTTSGQAVGSHQAVDASTGARSAGTVHLRTLTTVGFTSPSVATSITDSAPFAWTTDDVLTFEAHYLVA